jgi:Tetratricopeptide repeat/Cytochrome c554 and c-prime
LKGSWIPLIAAAFLTVPLKADTGSRACAPCHQSIYNSYSKTPMALSSGSVSAGSIIESFSNSGVTGPGGAANYHVSTRDGVMSYSFQQGGVKGTRRLDYFIGSGVVGRSYLTALGEFLFQAPVSYYTPAKRWDVSPGFEKSTDVNLIRGVEPSCLRCHASGVQHIPGTANGYRQPAFLEGGIGCQRCHGPGEAHIAKMKFGKSPETEIVNPARLAGPQRDSICAQCHLAGASEIARGRSSGDFRPGDTFSDYVTVFLWDSPGGALAVNSHFERMTQSACRKATGDKFWCGSCHDPHSLPEATKKAAYFRDRCFQCHTDSSCTAPAPARAKAANDCVQCHMPRTGAPTVKHAAFTDHSIPRIRPGVPHSGIPRDASLVTFGGTPASDRELGLAYADVAIKENNRLWGMKAFELLSKAAAEHPYDARVASQLAQLYDRMGNEQKACELYAQAVASDPAAIAPKVNLGTCLAKQGRLGESINVWADVVSRSPGMEAARLNLAVAQFQSGDSEAAKATLSEALKFNPASQKAREILSQIQSGAR